MCIQPQHTELPAPLAAVSSDRTDGTDAEAMVAAQQYGHAGIDEFPGHRIVDRAIPFGHLAQVPIAAHRSLHGICGSAQIAAIAHINALRFQHGTDVGDAQGLRPHRGSAGTGANIARSADQRDMGVHDDAHADLRMRDLAPNPNVPPNKSFGLSRSGTRSICRVPPRSSFSRECRNRSAE